MVRAHKKWIDHHKLITLGYMRTGDEAVIRKAPSGHEHVFIVDRIKELIKVKVSFY